MIDTSTTAGKIAVMQAFADGKAIVCITKGSKYNSWSDLAADKEPNWIWVDVDYKIKPQTVEEAAGDFAKAEGEKGDDYTINCFIRGAQWQKDQL